MFALREFMLKECIEMVLASMEKKIMYGFL